MGEGESCQGEENTGKYWEERDFMKIVLEREKFHENSTGKKEISPK